MGRAEWAHFPAKDVATRSHVRLLTPVRIRRMPALVKMLEENDVSRHRRL